MRERSEVIAFWDSGILNRTFEDECNELDEDRGEKCVIPDNAMDRESRTMTGDKTVIYLLNGSTT